MTEADRQRADALHEEARTFEDDDRALAQYHEVLALDPRRPTTLYNIGLIHKYRGQWRESLRFNERSVALDPDNEAANWNLAIAATALRDWTAARAAWKRLGICIAEGEGPITEDFGGVPLRLNPDTQGEVVWGQRIDPVRAELKNIPFPESGFRCGDLVLHDGAPVGSREWNGREYSVFNVLELFEPSHLTTYVAAVEIGSGADATELADALNRAGILNEDWTATTRVLCKQCSEGRPHEHHDQDLQREWKDRHVLGIAMSDPTQAQSVISAWANARRRLISLDVRLTPPKRH